MSACQGARRTQPENCVVVVPLCLEIGEVNQPAGFEKANTNATGSIRKFTHTCLTAACATC
jgi:hypothetical protein